MECEEPKEDDYEELHGILLREDVVEDPSSIQQVTESRNANSGKSKVKDLYQ